VSAEEHLVLTPSATTRPGTVAAVLWAAAERWGQQLFSFAVFIVLARLLEPTAFGLVALASLCLSFCTILVDSGLGAGIVRLRHVDAKHLSSAFWLGLGLSTALLTATGFIAPFLSRWMGVTELAPVLRVLALSLPIAALTTVPSALLTRHLRFDTLTKRTVLGVMVGGVAGMAAAGLHWGVWSLVVQQITATVIGAAFLWTSVRWRPTADISIRHLRDVGGIGLAVVANAIAWFICQRADQAVLGAAMGAHELALYAMAMKLVMLIVDLLCVPIGRAALPILAEQQDDRDAFERTYVRLTAAAVLGAFPVLVGLSLVAPEGVAAVLGDRWQESALVVRLLLGYGLVIVLFTLNDAAMIAKSRTRLYVAMLVLNAITTPLASLIGVRWGLEGVATAATANLVLHGVLGMLVWQFSLHVRVKAMAAAVLPLFVACGCMAAAVLLWRMVATFGPGPWPSLIGSILVGAAVYTGAVYLLAPELMAELKRRLRAVADVWRPAPHSR
jgi:O-antigen/teichoic acid export membrane protein